LPAVRPLLRALVLGAVAVGIVVPAAAANADPNTASLQQQIDQSNNNLENIVEQYNHVNTQLQATQAEIDQLTAQLGPLQAKLDEAYTNIGLIAQTAYKGGELGAFNSLLTSGSPTSLMDGLSSLNILARGQQQQIATYRKTKADFDAHRKQLDALLAQQTAQRNDLVARKAKIESDVAKLMELRKRAFGRATEAPPPRPAGPPPRPPAVSGAAGAVVAYAYRALGVPYVWAGASIAGFDCSGLVMMAWLQAGVHLAHGVSDQWGQVRHIPRSALAPGDIVFYRSLGHDAIYIGNGQVIHAPHTGTVVKIASVDMMVPYGFGRP
jgi:cell wall-associated NlpC family hydrolase